MSKSCTARTIYCPECGRKVGSHDGKATNVKEMECRKCWKTVVFNPMNAKTTIKPRARRVSSSGVTFR